MSALPARLPQQYQAVVVVVLLVLLVLLVLVLVVVGCCVVVVPQGAAALQSANERNGPAQGNGWGGMFGHVCKGQAVE